MTIDIHTLLENNPVRKAMLKPKFGYKFLGPYNGPLEDQMLYDKESGEIYKYYDKPKNVLDKIASRHDICYELKPKNKGLCDRIMVKELMMKSFVKSNNTVWYNILPELINTYNNRYHHTINMKPIDVNKSNEKHIEMINNYNIINKKPKYEINDFVRIS